MTWLVLCMVGGVYEQSSIVKNVRADDCTVELVIIASNDTVIHNSRETILI